jgi:hypothetical protein
MIWEQEQQLSSLRKVWFCGEKKIHWFSGAIGYSVSEHEVWRPAIFASLEAAKLMFELNLNDDKLDELQSRAVEEREDRCIPIEWIQELEAKKND